MNGIAYGLEDKVAVVTGGSRGIGLALARSLLAQGAKVVICSRKEENLAAAVDKLGGGERLYALPAHVAREGDVERLFDAAVSRFGGLDILVNNVGMNLLTASVVDADLAVWNKIIEGNLTGAFLCARKAARIMREKKRGKIVSISSLAGTKASPGMGILHLLGEVRPADVKIGMKVEAVWRPKRERKGAVTDIAYFRPRR